MTAFRVVEARPIDVGRGTVRLDPADLRGLGARIGDVLRLTNGQKSALAKALPIHPAERGQSVIQMDGTTRSNAGIGLGESVEVARIDVQNAEVVALEAVDGQMMQAHLIGRALEGIPMQAGDLVRVNRIGATPQHYRVLAAQPEGAVIVTSGTHITLNKPEKRDTGSSDGAPQLVSYEDIGGLDREIQRIREMIELPMRFPQVFQHLGITPPKGVLLYGPPGTGKTLIARALARETNAHFIVINGPEIIDKLYGQSESALRRVFEEASRRAPSIVFIDEIDAIAPKRSQVQGEVEKRVVAQLLTLMDGLEDRGEIVVIGATNLPDHVDPALRRPGRFDREIALPIPNRAGREAILNIHARGMPLAGDVDLARIASGTHGFVGADLQALCREAAMHALRRFLRGFDLNRDSITLDDLMGLTVCGEDWDAALLDVSPSTTREVFAEVPDVTWDDVGGLVDVKKALRDAIELPLLYPDLFTQAKLPPPRGILLSGAPGGGKTLLAKAVAHESGVNFIGIRGPELLSKWVGESEGAVREVFRIARMASPCVLFFDEFDSLAHVRSGADPVAERVVAQLLTEMDGLEDTRGVIVLASTNRPDLIDPALRRPGRLDLHIEIGLPDGNARREIFAIHMRGRPTDPTLNFDALAGAADGWSGAEIAEWCRRATLRAVQRSIETKAPLLVTPDDFAAALNAVG